MKRNPPLAVYANPPRGSVAFRQVMGTQVYAVEYRHAEDDKDYRHEFEGKVEMVALANGDILLRRPGHRGGPLWEDF